MAAARGQNKQGVSTSDTELLLHPELLSNDFLQLILRERNVGARGCEDRDRLTELYLRHVIPLPQRTLPNSRWGRKMERSRGRQAAAGQSSSNDQHRKRPLIVFDGKSSQSGPLKLKKPDCSPGPPGVTDRLKPPPAANLSNPIRKLSGTSSPLSSSSTHRSSDASNIKRDAESSATLKSPEVKKKIQHVTWP
ncbi:ashwin [Cyprinodon tularosa]|uniref:ashwin n=1 Tax=Cyprinodon tularosa TaxID=77115 RepID=UPI0018E1EB36|nr:ashwin [Cyprinodon tularosa]